MKDLKCKQGANQVLVNLTKISANNMYSNAFHYNTKKLPNSQGSASKQENKPILGKFTQKFN